MIGRGSSLDWDFDPLEALRRWSRERPVVLLHSGRPHPRWARRSILAEPAGSFRFSVGADGRAKSQWIGGPPPFDPALLTSKPFHDLRVVLDGTDGLWIGSLAYDLGRWVERLPESARNDRAWPVIDLAYCPGYLAYDTAAERWWASGTWRGGGNPDLASRAPEAGAFEVGPLTGVFDRAGYERVVSRALDYIAAGDIFQANLTQRFTAAFTGEPPLASRALFDRLAGVSPAWYGAYVELAAAPGEPRRAIASTSPELFLEVDANRRVVTRPIKGTRPASATAEELRRSAKDEAELNMIVDLLRNDLGRVCAYGSVRVPEPRSIETHPTVHHGVATVTGTLHESMDVVDLLRAAFPGGSITGAPKVRAMEIIEELEPVRRGPYCGAIGFLSREETCLNIAIRTLLVEQGPDGIGKVDFSVGGGIVADSDPAAEYQETLDKAAALLRALGVSLTPASVTGHASRA